jgi:hypothetical protein
MMSFVRLCWLAPACLIACGPSGVLVEAHATFHLDELLLYAAIDDGKGQFVLDPRLTAKPIDISSRSLAITPYRVLLLDDNQDAGHQAILAIVGRRGNAAVAFGEVQPPQPFHDGQLLVRTLELAEFSGPPPFAVRDTGCLEIAGATSLGSQSDHDCDGYANPASGGNDCNDEDPNVHPGAPEVCGNGIDDNCNGLVDEDLDQDGDGYRTCSEPRDCNDQDATVHPGAPEICDGKDNDCDGHCDEPFDQDGDGFTTCGSQINRDGTCEPPSPSRVDCNDHDGAVHPGAAEICNGIDDNCDGHCDEGFDSDGDGYTTCGTLIEATGACSGPPSSTNVDCNDMNAFVHPGQREVCDGLDDNCDGVRAGSSEFCFVNAGQCLVGQRSCNDDVPPGFTSACQPGSDVAPPAYCSAYASCDAMTSRLDKLACTAEAVPARLLVCELAFTATGLCPGAQYLLPGPMTGPCTWTLDGTTTRDGYTLGLLDAQMVARTSSTSCMPFLGVTNFSSVASPSVTSAFLHVDGPNAMSSSFGLLITPVTFAACPPLPFACR